MIAVSVWFLMGFYMLIFLGGLQDIPREYYEAARIDGAGPVQSFFRITLPLLQPTSFFVLLVSTVAAVCGSQTFDLVYVMTKGGPANSTSLAIFYIYQQAFLFNEYGYAAAMASVLVLVLDGDDRADVPPDAAADVSPMHEQAPEDRVRRRMLQPVQLALYLAGSMLSFMADRAAVLDGVDVAEGDE